MFRKLWIPSESLLRFIFWLKVSLQVFHSGAFHCSPSPTFNPSWCGAFLKMGAVTSVADFRIDFVVTQTPVDILHYCFCHAIVGCLQTTKLTVFKIVYIKKKLLSSSSSSTVTATLSRRSHPHANDRLWPSGYCIFIFSIPNCCNTYKIYTRGQSTQ